MSLLEESDVGLGRKRRVREEVERVEGRVWGRRARCEAVTEGVSHNSPKRRTLHSPAHQPPSEQQSSPRASLALADLQLVLLLPVAAAAAVAEAASSSPALAASLALALEECE